MSRAGASGMRRGMDRTVRRFSVTSSPTWPSPGWPPDEQAVLILQGHRQPIHLGLHVVLRPRDGGADPLVKLAQLVIVEHILKGFQGDLMDHLLEGLQGLPPYPLGGRVGG